MLQIIKPVLTGERKSLAGKCYRAENAINEPRFRNDLPILLSGGGEKTFALAARRADHILQNELLKKLSPQDTSGLPMQQSCDRRPIANSSATR